jgi:hypothetical protein
MIDICLLYGYVYDPYYISFYIANDVHNHGTQTEPQDMTYQIIIDCMMFIDIVFLSLITFVNDHGEWEVNLWQIFKNYAKQ